MQRGGRPDKAGLEAIANGLEDYANMASNRRAEDGTVQGKGALHCFSVLLRGRGRALDVGEEEGDGASRQVSHSCGTPGVLAWALSCGASRNGRAAGWRPWLPYASVPIDPLLSLPVGITRTLVCTCAPQRRGLHPLLPAGHGSTCTCG